MVQVSIEEKLWNDFIIDSRKKGLVASQRIVNFIKKELNIKNGGR